MRLVLFDIDGTLLLTGGAGSRALRRALYEVYGLTEGMEGIRPDGKTDPLIVREALRRNGQDADSQGPLSPAFFPSYVAHLREEIGASGDKFVVLPGVCDLLFKLQNESRFMLGLATGNIEEGARVKLEHAALTSFFSFGGYGSDAEDRTEVVRIAIRRGLERIGPARPEAIFVVGDTPRDIVHAKEAGARTIAVASGVYTREELQHHQPDLLVDRLDPLDPIMTFLYSA